MAETPETVDSGETKAQAAEPTRPRRGWLLDCLICGKLLRPGERRVHRGRCARMRVTQTQRERRRRNAI